jgi:hypothetical protein
VKSKVKPIELPALPVRNSIAVALAKRAGSSAAGKHGAKQTAKRMAQKRELEKQLKDPPDQV